MTSNSSQNISSCSTGGSDAAVGSSWLGFSLSPHMAATMDGGAADGSRGVPGQQPHGGLCYPPVVCSSPAPFGYALGGGGQDCPANGGGGFYPGLSSMPLNSDGSLCIVEALHRSEQERHGVMVSPKLEDFLGASTAMALSLDSSSFYYGGGHGHHAHGDGHGHDQGGYLQPLQCAVIPSSGGHDVYGGHSHLVDQQSAVAMAESWFSARGGGYDVNGGGAGDIVPLQGHTHPLALSMSSGTGSQSSSITMQVGAHADAVTEYVATDGSKKRGGGGGNAGQKQAVVHRKSIDTFGQRTSKYRGVTRHRWTGRYEAHLWDNSCRKEGQARKGRQVYLGGYDMEEKAARAYDLAALKYWGKSTHVNFPVEDYREELEEMENMTRQEYVAHLRRKSSGFSRGASIYRGVTRHHQHGRWQARIGRVSGNKDLYLGTFTNQEEAAEAYDVAAIKFRGLSAVTNFDITRYDVEKIMESNTLLPGDQVRRKMDGQAASAVSEADAVASATAALVQAGGRCVADTWKIQAAALPAVARGGGGGHEQQQQHQDLLSSEAFSLLHDILSVDAAGTGSGSANAHMSNSSSLAPSVSNSREQSPDRGSGGLAMFFAKPAAAVPRLACPLPLGSWVSPSAVSSARPGVSIAHLPMFAAWTDA
ncbi:hypothetical protein BDA96_01G078700 [Sorghum bicolor]|uniref:AP2/ERF domain-containing protein n=2 Tax=Sorghum bicolor TaxID=4558 RepID=A0A921UWG2_SORBI|nr:AP2-like ethylene-responsive transcription factor ANT [Sorghum bicolor]EER93382.2 hypothetical protein SORBI_3001G075700 [Sorghum bicolor]KAG0547419.1 hypothetical protein BDA96_01G078700 [Sorghum bicolor]|eukprot:XP_021319373.1 AP2-like ethylene-responsive transcription factor ANT [Sorghum bicolor]